MCLDYVHIPKEKAGYGYKMVWPTDQFGVWKPEYQHFGVSTKFSGCGGTGFADGSFTTHITYSLFKTAYPDIQFFTVAASGERYPTGIHLYKSLSAVPCLSHAVLIKCHYNKAVAEDDRVVVAMEVTPVEVVRPGWIVRVWDELPSSKGKI